MEEIFHRLQRIDRLIKMKCTGTPSQLANKIGLSKRTIYQYLKLMKDFGAPIEFSNSRGSYYYEVEGNFLISFQPAEHQEEIPGQLTENGSATHSIKS